MQNAKISFEKVLGKETLNHAASAVEMGLEYEWLEYKVLSSVNPSVRLEVDEIRSL